MSTDFVRRLRAEIDVDVNEPLDRLLEQAADEIERLHKAIQNYLDGNWGTRLPSKIDKCPHDRFGWEDCGNCIDEYFAGVLRASGGLMP